MPGRARPRARRRAAAVLGAGLAVTAVLVAIVVGVTWRAGGRRPTAAPAATDRDGVLRVEALLAELARLDRQGASADGDRLLAAFLTDERSPDGLALAWLARGDRGRARTGVWNDEVVTSYATAYARAADPAVQRRALLAVAHSYQERWEWDRLAAAIEVLDELPGPPQADIEALRDRLRLAVRDGAAAAAPASATGRIAGALLVGHPAGSPMTAAASFDVDADGDLDLLAIEGGELVARTAETLTVLARRPVGTLDDIRCVGRDDHGAYAVVAARNTLTGHQLVPLDGGPAIALDPSRSLRVGHCRAIDLDGQRGDELYLLTDGALVRMTRGVGRDRRRSRRRRSP